MTLLPAPNLFADFTGAFGTTSFILNGSAVDNFADLLSALGGSFSRASTASYTNSAGLLTQALSGALRSDYDPVLLTSKGILLEGASTNVLLHSTDLTNVVWAQEGGGPSLANNAVGPDGAANSACTFTSNGSDGGIFQDAASSGSNNTGSVYVKAGTAAFAFILLADTGVSNLLGITVNLSTLVIGSPFAIVGSVNGFTLTGSVQQYSNGWIRFSATGSVAITRMDFGISDTNNNIAVANGETGIFYGPQLEALPFASSYIPTAASSLMRQADSLTAPISGFNNLTGTILATVNGGALAQTQTVISFNDGSTNNSVAIQFLSTGAARPIGLAGGVIQFSNATANGTVTANTTFGSAIVFNQPANSSAISLAGAAPVTGTDATAPTGINHLDIGQQQGTVNLFGNILNIGYWPTAFANAQLQTLSSGIFSFNLNTILATTLTNKSGRYFSRKDYAKWLARIVGENEESRREYQRFIDEAEAERSLTYIERADRDYNVAEEQLSRAEDAVFGNLTEVNHIKFSEARENRDRARKERDHQYFMDVVNKEWAKYNEAKRR